MVVDIGFPFSYASDGDIETVNGRDFYEQHALLLALDAQVTIRGTPATANDIIELEGRLERQFSDSPFLSEPTVTVTDVTDADVQIQVTIEEVDAFEMTVPTE